MVVGTGIVELLIAESRSLKEKRGILNRIIKRTQNEFNVSIAEIGAHDNWKRARIGFSVVGNEHPYINGKIDYIIRYIDSMHLAEVLHARVEIITIPDSLHHVDYGEDKYSEL